MAERHEDIQSVMRSIFPELSPEELGELATASSLRVFPKGRRLVSEGKVPGGTDWLLAGTVELIKSSTPGKDIVLHVLQEGHFIDLCSLFHEGPFFLDVLALEDCRVLRMDSRILRGIAARNGNLALRLMRALAMRQRMYVNKISMSHGKISARRRVAGWLLHKARMEHSPEISDRTTREVLAGLLGITRESLSRQLSRFARDGIIDLRRGSIRILNEEALRRAKND